MGNIIRNIVLEKCPYCDKGDVYRKKQRIIEIPRMYQRCENCGKDFTGEPGYFFGAMYVSYGIAVGAGILTFLILKYFFNLSSFNLYIAIIMGVIALISVKNFKWSRIIWLKMFPPGAGTNFSRRTNH